MGDQLGISKPATVLIEKVSDFIGGVFEPRQIERKARARAKADKIKAESDIEIRDIQERADKRRDDIETKKQENIEKITAGAINQLKDDAKPENIEDDWIANFFNNCSLISDKEMQEIWSKILAGEGNSPGSFSKRAVNIVMNLDKSDIELFTNLSTFIWYFGTSPIPLVYDETDEIYTSKGINFGVLIHLEDIGLIQFRSWGFTIREGKLKFSEIFYYGTPTAIKYEQIGNNSAINIGKVLLTKAGMELLSLCNSSPSEDFRQYTINKLRELNHIPD